MFDAHSIALLTLGAIRVLDCYLSQELDFLRRPAIELLPGHPTHERRIADPSLMRRVTFQLPLILGSVVVGWLLQHGSSDAG